MNAIDPRLVVFDASNTPYSVKYENLTAVLAKAIKEIATITGTFKSNLIAWLGNAENGIQDLFAKNIYATNITADHGYFGDLTASSTISAHTILGDEVCAKKSDGTSVCITGDQLSALLSGSVLGVSTQSKEAAGAPAIGGSGAPASQPTSPQADANTTSTITPSDTSTASSSPPVSATSSPPQVPPPANDNQATSTLPAANDNVPVDPLPSTGTDASSTQQ